jgi:hypothetical protein
MPTTTTISARGHVGTKRRIASRSTSAEAPTASVVALVSPRLPSVTHSFLTYEPSPPSTPRILCDWSMIRPMPNANTNPASTALERKFAIQPIFAMPSAM